jgi:hypothetical protein
MPSYLIKCFTNMFIPLLHVGACIARGLMALKIVCCAAGPDHLGCLLLHHYFFEIKYVICDLLYLYFYVICDATHEL